MKFNRFDTVRSALLIATGLLLSQPLHAEPECEFRGLVVFAPDGPEVEEGGELEFEVRREGMSTAEALELEIEPASYLNGSINADFESLPRVTIAAGDTSARFTVTTVDDEAYVGNRSVRFSAKPVDGPELPVRLWDVSVSEKGKIVENDTRPEVSVVEAKDALEGGDAGGFTIERSGNLSGDLVVFYELGLTAGDMAAPVSDYELPEGSFLLPKSTGGVRVGIVMGALTLPDGESSAVVSISAVDDAVVGESDHVRLTLLSGDYSQGTNSEELAIEDNDESMGLPQVKVEVLGQEIEPGVTLFGGASEEGDDGEPEPAYFSISRDGKNGDLTVTFELSGTATMGTHYEEIPLSVAIPDGEKSVQVPIVPINDEVGTCFVYPGELESKTDLQQQSARSVFLQISDSTDYEVTQERAQQTINDVEDLACWLRSPCATRTSFAPGELASFVAAAQPTRKSIEKVEIAHVWDFGDGTPACEMEDVFDAQAHVFDEPGTYQVSVQAIASTTFSSNMESFSMSQTLEIEVGDEGEVVACAGIGDGTTGDGDSSCLGPACAPDEGDGDGDGSGNGSNEGDAGADGQGESSGGGCGCRVAAPGGSAGWLLPLVFGLILWRRRATDSDSSTSI